MAKFTTSFSYNHPTAGPIQHKNVDVLEHKLDRNHLHICFTDLDGKRQVTIDTNSTYTLREEAVEEPAVEAPLIGDTGRPQ